MATSNKLELTPTSSYLTISVDLLHSSGSYASGGEGGTQLG